jgi:CheY-like chemotaxis protein
LPLVTPKELRSRRIGLGLTVQQLARELDLTLVELQQMEDGLMPLPPHEHLADALVRVEKERSRDCLLVEDDESVRALFASRLRAEGLTVDEAADGLAALDASTHRDYRLLLLDLKLPKLSGAEVLARMVKKKTPPANVIIISAADSGDVRTVAGNRSVSAILKKAFAISNADIVFPALAALARA